MWLRTVMAALHVKLIVRSCQRHRTRRRAGMSEEASTGGAHSFNGSVLYHARPYSLSQPITASRMLACSPLQGFSLGTRCAHAQSHVASLNDYERVASSPRPVAFVLHRVNEAVVPSGTMKFPALAPRHRNAREPSCPSALSLRIHSLMAKSARRADLGTFQSHRHLMQMQKGLMTNISFSIPRTSHQHEQTHMGWNSYRCASSSRSHHH